MRRPSARARVFLALAALAPVPLAQEPPSPGGGQDEQQEEKKDEKKQEGGEQSGGERQDPAPAPQDVPPAPETGPTGSAEVAANQPAPAATEAARHPPVVWPLAIDAIALHLRGIAEAHPTLASLEVLGRGTGGHEILALRLGLREGVPPLRPTLLLADYQGAQSAGAEAMLEVAWRLAEEGERDEHVRALLTGAMLVIAPALDPGARSAAADSGSADTPRPATRFERNFPSGWQPETIRAGSGRVPLSLPETLAAARFLTGLQGCAVVLGFTAASPRGAPYAEAQLPGSDREVFAKLAAALELDGTTPLVPWFELGSPGGGLFDFAYQARGIYPLLFTLPAEEELAAGGPSALAAQVLTRVMRCMTLLPRVEIAQEGLERLASDTWALDVRIQNAGIVPTSSALVRHREAQAEVALALEGAKLVATARKPVGGADYTDAELPLRTPSSGGTLSGGVLAGGEARWVRLFLEAGSGTAVRVSASALWAGSTALQVTLP